VNDAPAVTAATKHDSVAALYAESFGRLVGLLTVTTGSYADAEEIVQEAFARLILAWGKVRAYDDPEAWVRAVAFRLATSRWRRARVAARALPLLGGATADVPPPDETRLEAERLLAALPVDQRQVLVLHHGLGMPVEQIARELDIAVGTVKSRLSRGRTAAAALRGAES